MYTVFLFCTNPARMLHLRSIILLALGCGWILGGLFDTMTPFGIFRSPSTVALPCPKGTSASCPSCPPVPEAAQCPYRPEPGQYLPPPAMPTFRDRTEFGSIAARLGLKRGVELGVRRGEFSVDTLQNWRGCEEYVFVDLWRRQTNYVDTANVDNSEQERRFQETLRRTKQWSKIRKVCRNYTSVCATTFPDDYFDFVYVDARHDRKGCYEDIAAYWPKLRKGGIMAGHDYITQTDLTRERPSERQNWTVNYDGTVDRTGDVVKGAVDEFFMSGTPETNPHYRQVTVGYGERMWWSWAVRK